MVPEITRGEVQINHDSNVSCRRAVLQQTGSSVWSPVQKQWAVDSDFLMEYVFITSVTCC